MKKIIKKFAIAALLLTTSISTVFFSACQNEEKEVVNAYEIAVQNGFVGTEQEWLASLKGNNGADGEDITIEDIYEASGFDGTLEEFIAYYMNEQKFPVQEDNDTETIAKNTSSVVSICAGFQKTTLVRDRWGRATTKTQVSGAEGSGVIYKMESNGEYVDAYVVTNYHVIYGGNNYTDNVNGISTDVYVYLYGAREMFNNGDVDGDGYLDDGATMKDEGDGIKATFVGGAMDYDIAILKISDNKYLPNSIATEAKFGNSVDVRLGEKVFAIGNANGHGIAVTSGAISVDSEYIEMKSTDGQRAVSYRVMRTDAAINHGNSGGALFNTKGELIGITNAKNIEDETDNMGYALPISQVECVLNNIMANAKAGVPGYVSRAWLGVETYLQSSVASFVDGHLRTQETFFVSKDLTGSQAGAAAGKFQAQDVFKAVKIGDGAWTYFERRYQLSDVLLNVRKGDVVTFKVLRNNVETDVVVPFDKDEYFIRYA